MTKFSQKHAQYALGENWNENCHKVWRKSNQKNRNLQKTSPKNKQISVKTSPKTSNPQVFKKTRNSTKNKPELVGKPQGWQHCRSLTLTKDISNLWKHCYIFTHASFYTVHNHTWLTAISSVPVSLHCLLRCLCSTVTCRSPIQWFQIISDCTPK